MITHHNQTILVGNIAREPEYAESSEAEYEKSELVMVVATDNFGNGKKYAPSYIPVVAKGALARSLKDIVQKGDYVFVQGKLQSSHKRIKNQILFNVYMLPLQSLDMTHMLTRTEK
jgi:single-stranded DNA-binding protein